MTDKKRTIKSTVSDAEVHAFERVAPGVIFRNFEHLGRLAFSCPGCGHVASVSVGDPKPPHSPSWLMQGPIDSLTLTPSINCINCCGWHGFLRNGVFESC